MAVQISCRMILVKSIKLTTREDITKTTATFLGPNIDFNYLCIGILSAFVKAVIMTLGVIPRGWPQKEDGGKEKYGIEHCYSVTCTESTKVIRVDGKDIENHIANKDKKKRIRYFEDFTYTSIYFENK